MTEFRDMSATELWNSYERTIRLTVRSFGFRGPDEDDLVQDIFIKLVYGEYQEIFDPAKGKPQTLIQALARRYCLQKFDKNKRTPTAFALSIQPLTDEEFVPGIVSDEVVAGVPDCLEDVLYEDLIDRTLVALSETPKKGKRDLVRLFTLLLEGYNQKEIAALMGLSTGTVNYMVRDLRGSSAVSQLRSELVSV